MANSNKDIKVAVIGAGTAPFPFFSFFIPPSNIAGALGLVTLKNLLEEGFDATGFERKSYVGGLWKYTLDETTSVLPCKLAVPGFTCIVTGN